MQVHGEFVQKSRIIENPKKLEVISQDPDFKWIDRTSRWLDSKFIIPGTKIRFGFDPILSVLPAAGDIVTLLISGMLVFQMQKHGVSRKVVIKMLFNVLIDALIGAIPILGIIFDVYYKANDRNVKLLKEHYREGKHRGSGTGLIILFLFGILLVMSAIIYLFYKIIHYLWEL